MKPEKPNVFWVMRSARVGAPPPTPRSGGQAGYPFPHAFVLFFEPCLWGLQPWEAFPRFYRDISCAKRNLAITSPIPNGLRILQLINMEELVHRVPLPSLWRRMRVRIVIASHI